MSLPVPLSSSSVDSDNARWSAWRARNELSDKRQAASLFSLAQYLTFAVLAITTLLSQQAAPYHVAIRFLVSLGALAAVAQAWHLKRHAFLAAFVAITILFNPLFPAFHWEGETFSLFPALTALAFVASIVWLRSFEAAIPLQSSQGFSTRPTIARARHAAWETGGGIGAHSPSPATRPDSNGAGE